jgi:hypothetical protein
VSFSALCKAAEVSSATSHLSGYKAGSPRGWLRVRLKAYSTQLQQLRKCSKARKQQIFSDDLSNSGLAVRLYVEGRANGPPQRRYRKKTVTEEGEVMPQYLVAVYHPDDYDPSVETEAMIEEIHALNREMIAAGARKFACGLSPAGNAKSLRAQPDGKVLVTDGPYTETKEHMGGFWILEAANLDEALAWARKGAVACRASGEVREILFNPDPKGATGRQ